MISPQAYKTRFIKKEQVSTDAYSFYFEKNDFTYAAGQYIKLSLEIENPDERGTTRLFTLSSSPTEDFLMITTRIIQSSFKKTLASLPEGTEVNFFGPLGRFTLQEDDLSPRVFLAGGIGITPLRSMIVYANDKALPIPITIITSFRSKEDMVFRDELHAPQKGNHTFNIIETLTEPKESDSWEGHVGRVNGELLKSSIPDLQAPIYYISGPQAMVEGLSNVVSSLGIPEDRIKKENFSGY